MMSGNDKAALKSLQFTIIFHIQMIHFSLSRLFPLFYTHNIIRIYVYMWILNMYYNAAIGGNGAIIITRHYPPLPCSSPPPLRAPDVSSPPSNYYTTTDKWQVFFKKKKNVQIYYIGVHTGILLQRWTGGDQEVVRVRESLNTRRDIILYYILCIDIDIRGRGNKIYGPRWSSGRPTCRVRWGKKYHVGRIWKKKKKQKINKKKKTESNHQSAPQHGIE